MTHEKMNYTYVGVDSHSDTHTAVLLTCFYERIGRITFQNAPSAFGGFLKKAESLKMDGTSLLFGLEDTCCYGRTLTAFLVKKGFRVKHVNSSLTAQERKSMSLTAQKTDAIDGECAARILLSKLDSLPNAAPQDRHFILKSMVTHRQAMVKMGTMLKNQLHSLVDAHYPSYRTFFYHFDCNSSLTFFMKYPSPSTLRGVGVDELHQILYEASRRRWKRDKAEYILSCVHKDGDTTVEFQEMRDSVVRAVAGQLMTLMKDIEKIEESIAQCLEWFDYPLTSMKGMDVISAAGFIAEIGDIKRFPSAAKLAQYAALAPVTYASGQTDKKYANKNNNRQLNSLFYQLAMRVSMTKGENGAMINPIMHEYYMRKQHEGKTKKQALKAVQRRLANIIWKMMTYNVPYDNPTMEEVGKNDESEEK
jgi:transposase